MTMNPDDYQPYDRASPSTGGRSIPPPPPPPPPSTSNQLAGTFFQSCMIAGCVTIFVPVLIVLGFFMLVYLAASSGLEQASGGFGSIVQSSSTSNLVKRVLREGTGGAIAVVSIHGVIDGGGSTLEGDGSLAFVSEQLRAASADFEVSAIILQIDSPGGGLTASDQLYNMVKTIREDGTPVVAWAGNMMASGGYYIAVGADEIMASPTATVGSIGVILQHFQVKELLAKIGVKVDPITSGERKDIASPFRDMTPEERELLQAYIDNAHRRFVGVVAEGRKMPEEKVREFADGGIFSAEVAKEKGLVDSIGYIEDAIKLAEQKAGGADMKVIGYRRVISLGDLFREAGSGAAGAAIESAANADPSPRAMAVWEGK